MIHWIKHLLYKHEDSDPQHFREPNIVMCACNPSIPAARWEADTVEPFPLPEAYRPASQVNTAANSESNPASNKVEGEDQHWKLSF